jgi:uncharacterized protein YeaO (DUF488 family)
MPGSKDLVRRNIRLKRIYEPPSEDDGHRVLATRYWPRGVEKSAIDEYLPVLSPSRELLHLYRQGQLDWARFCRQYVLEMSSEGPRTVIHRLAKVARAEVITVMCVCADEDHCHRTLLRELISGFDEE